MKDKIDFCKKHGEVIEWANFVNNNNFCEQCLIEISNQEYDYALTSDNQEALIMQVIENLELEAKNARINY